MKIGDYVRTKRGTFDRFITSHTQDNLTWYTFEDRGNITNPENYVVKSSPNIIDLIEIGDLVYVDISPDDCGGIIVPRITETEKELNSLKSLIENKDYILKSIITHEQIESMEYKVKE